MGELLFNRFRVSVLQDEICGWIVVMVAQYEYIILNATELYT